ncbi:hypothetical protein TL16_g12356 [Triparma laevis f. inornata]|uniref:UBA domain-containing protein n=1 Tax=Triparma laevis f. inornata TaxID=1714386 RepID=A0A9W7BRM7_9STRA|nr:hypothetical protein TL16_g12356 [Triparma laevis f. inornata]
MFHSYVEIPKSPSPKPSPLTLFHLSPSQGFPESSCLDALTHTNNNLERAVALLLNPPPPSTPTVVDMTSNGGGNSEEDDLKLAIALSKQESEQERKPDKVKSAAVRKSGSAALKRSTGTATSSTSPTKPSSSAPVASHPKVVVPKTLSEKPFLEIISRSISRLSPSSLAVDTLTKTLSTIRDNPTTPKFRRIDMNSKGFKRALGNVPGCIDLLTLGVGFTQSSTPNIYTLQFVDSARIYAALETLEAIKIKNYEYNLDRIRRIHDNVIHRIMETQGEEEIKLRAELMRKTPMEPGGMGCSVISLIYNSTGSKISRKFASDDIIRDIFNWISGSLGTQCSWKIESGNFVIVSRNQHPKERLGGEEWREVKERTLQSVGMWPSGELEMVSKESWEMDCEEGRQDWENKVRVL